MWVVGSASISGWPLELLRTRLPFTLRAPGAAVRYSSRFPSPEQVFQKIFDPWLPSPRNARMSRPAEPI